MTDATPSDRKPRIHPVDLLVLVLAVALAVLAYAYLFKRSPIPRPVDPFLGTVIELHFSADRSWKNDFLAPGDAAAIDEYLATDVEAVEALEDGEVRVVVRVRGRDDQKPEVMTLFRTAIRRGMRVTLASENSQVEAEIVRVEAPGAGE